MAYHQQRRRPLLGGSDGEARASPEVLRSSHHPSLPRAQSANGCCWVCEGRTSNQCRCVSPCCDRGLLRLRPPPAVLVAAAVAAGSASLEVAPRPVWLMQRRCNLCCQPWLRCAFRMTSRRPVLSHICRSHKAHSTARCAASFISWWYKHGWAHEPNPDDPLEVARHTNAVARATALVAEVPMIPLKGSIAKFHLLSFLQCLKAGNIYWSDTRRLMVPPEAQGEISEHIKYGMGGHRAAARAAAVAI